LEKGTDFKKNQFPAVINLYPKGASIFVCVALLAVQFRKTSWLSRKDLTVRWKKYAVISIARI